MGFEGYREVNAHMLRTAQARARARSRARWWRPRPPLPRRGRRQRARGAPRLAHSSSTAPAARARPHPKPQALAAGLEATGAFTIISDGAGGLPLVAFHLKDDPGRGFDEFHVAERLRMWVCGVL